jgi:hypothetical protein
MHIAKVHIYTFDTKNYTDEWNISNLVQLFQKLSAFFTNNSHIICLEQTYYLSWIVPLTYRHHIRGFWSDYRNLNTSTYVLARNRPKSPRQCLRLR